MKATLRIKILAGIIVPSIMMIAVAVYGSGAVNRVHERDNASAARVADLAKLAANVETRYFQAGWSASSLSTTSVDPAGRAESLATLNRSNAEVVNDLEKLGNADLSPEARRHWAEAVRTESFFNKVYNTLYGTNFSVADPSAPDLDMSSIQATIAMYQEYTNRLRNSLTALRDQIERDGVAARAQASTQASTDVRNLLLVGAIAALGAIGFGVWLSGRLVRRVHGMRDTLQQMADGDLTARCTDTSKDEIGEMAESLNQALGTMQGVISQIDMDARSLADMASTVADDGHAISSAGSSAALMSDSNTAEQLSDMVDNLNLLISVFRIEESPLEEAPV